MAIAAAPAQDVARMFATPPVDDLRRHLELTAVFAAIADKRPKVVDNLGRRVVPHMRRTGERFVIDSPARGDRPGQAGGSSAFPLAEIGMDPRDIWRAVAWRK